MKSTKANRPVVARKVEPVVERLKEDSISIDRIINGWCNMKEDGESYGIMQGKTIGVAMYALKDISEALAILLTLNPEGLRTRHLVEGAQHPLVGRSE